MSHVRTLILTALLTMGLAAAAALAEPRALAARAFEPSQVRLLDDPFKSAMRRDADWLLSVDADRLLSGFRTEAGLEPKAGKYGGWEARGVAGHSLGHYLSALSHLNAAAPNFRLQARIDHVVAELAECQAAHGNGYVGAIPGGAVGFAQIARGEVRADDRFNLNGIWVPWYTQHKVMAGLVDACRLAGNQQAKQVLVAFADWIGREVDALDERQMQEMLRVEQGGISESLADVYAIVGDEKYLRLAERFTHRAVTDPLAAGRDELTGLHANTQVPKAVAAARIYQLGGGDDYRRAAETFWRSVVRDRTFAQGGNSDHEHFFPPAETTLNLSAESAETCNVYNLLKLTKNLFEIAPTREAADYYELALYNQILGSQDPRRGMVTYYQPLHAGGYKVYSTPFDSWWCCTGTGMENHAKYGEAIYFHGDDTLWVNGFIPSELTWADKGLRLKQTSGYPAAETVGLSLFVEAPTRLTLKLRIPAWADGRPTLTINGEAVEYDDVDGYASVDREWQTGTRLTWTIPMAVRAELVTGADDKVAFLYGPITLAADLGDAGLTEEDFFPGTSVGGVRMTADAPVLVGSPAELAAGVRRVDDPAQWLTFRTEGIGRPGEVTLRPFSDTHFTRYAVYLDVLPDETAWRAKEAETAAERERERRVEARTVDLVRVGEQQSEVDHGYRGERSSSGSFAAGTWRDARDGGFFEYDVKLDPAAPLELLVRYWGGDNGDRLFDVLVDGRVIATQRLQNERPGEAFEIAYPVPPELTRGRDAATIRFQAKPGATAGGVLGLRVVRAE